MGGLAPGEYILVANARNYARGTVGTVVFQIKRRCLTLNFKQIFLPLVERL